MILIKNIKAPISCKEKEFLEERIRKKLKMNMRNLNYTIFKKSLDSRKKEDIHYVYQLLVDIDLSEEKIKKMRLKDVSVYVEEEFYIEAKMKFEKSPIVVGSGPAGLFATYILAKNGAKPILLERGKSVEEREIDIENFRKFGKLLENSNVQFGEGGAGTFSDGKLTSRSKDSRGYEVLKILVEGGAPEEILYMNKPHVGTDLLRKIIINLRKSMIEMGAQIFFNTLVEDIIIEGNRAKGVVTNHGNYLSDHIILALGHSARDTFKKLYEKNIPMENKAFAIGFRVEHKREFINKSQFGFMSDKLPSADYNLTYQDRESNRGIYTFCMCPGGEVIGASSQKNHLVVNGMSYHARDMENSNSALLVTVSAKDFGDGVLDGIYFQEEIERKAFVLGGSNYYAPVQKVSDYIENRLTEKLGEIEPTYKPGYTFANLRDLFNDEINSSMIKGLLGFNKKIKGFSEGDAILTGVETRSSSPVRILRDSNMESIGIKGIFPIGEGAGYSGGIMSSAIDGIKVAQILLLGK